MYPLLHCTISCFHFAAIKKKKKKKFNLLFAKMTRWDAQLGIEPARLVRIKEKNKLQSWKYLNGKIDCLEFFLVRLLKEEPTLSQNNSAKQTDLTTS